MKPRLTIYYDAACPRCRRDRQRYERWSGATEELEWFDINGHESELEAQGINPRKALTELHVRDTEGHLHSELDAYILLLERIPRMRWLAGLLGLPLIRPALARLYHHQVERRLRRQGRW